MEETKIYIGQHGCAYKNVRFNSIKYSTFAFALDYFALFRGYLQVDNEITKDRLSDLCMKNLKLWDWRNNRTCVNTAIDQMIMMGLLENNYGVLSLSKKGEDAFNEQTYHVIESNINAEKQSQYLSIIAVLIAIISILITFMR